MSHSEHLCARCARHMKTCCQTSEIYATPGDVNRIQEFTGLSDFVEFQAPHDPVYLEQDDDPTWSEYVFRDDGTRRVLKRKENGDCQFLGEQGCRLPLDVRPLICRLYPFDYTEAGIRPTLARGCPVELIKPGLKLLDELEMNQEQAEVWHRQLYQEVYLEKETYAHRSDV